MAGGSADNENGYSALMGLMYVFNLIVGTGALTMPKAFGEAGWLLSLVILLALAFMSFLTVTFVTEAMAAANAIVHSRAVRQIKRAMKDVEDVQDENSRMKLVEQFLTDEVISNSLENEKVPLLLSNSVDSVTETSAAEYFNITERIEMGKMASLFFNKIGVTFFYACIAIYLYGDLAIYAAAVSKSLRDVTCNVALADCNATINDTVQCWTSSEVINRGDAYRIYLVVFLAVLGPFTFFNVQKTKYLQVFTTIMRWLAFIMMITLASVALIQGKAKGHPQIADIKKTPNLFGVCVYSFMCHHSLPSLITPIRNKSHVTRLMLMDYVLILGFYSLLSFTGIFTFDKLQDIYTLNFEPPKCNVTMPSEEIIIHIPIVQYFLTLFPVFTLSTNFPIIAITLRNNLKSLFIKEEKNYGSTLNRVIFPVAAVLPPLGIAFITEDLTYLVGVTGSYAGAIIQYVIPALLVYHSRKDVLSILGLGIRNKHASPFKSTGWIVFVLLWAATSIIFVTVNHIMELNNQKHK